MYATHMGQLEASAVLLQGGGQDSRGDQESGEEEGPGAAQLKSVGTRTGAEAAWGKRVRPLGAGWIIVYSNSWYLRKQERRREQI